MINLSVGLYWQAIGHVPSYTNGADTMRVANVRNALNGLIQLLNGEGHSPLYVIAAGNDGIDAYWAGVTNSKVMFPNQVLVVGSLQAGSTGPNQFALASTSNRTGTKLTVDLAAPGEAVYSLRAAGTPTAVSGTSFAAPHVTGAAGLLISFDPRLPRDSVRGFLLRGARRGGRTAGGTPVLNVYESLKIAGEKRGAPLCGNPVYQDTLGRVFARRDSAWAFEEQLFTRLDSVMNPVHGGRRIRFASGNTHVWTLTNNAATWPMVAGLPDTITNATNRSKLGLSHDGDSTVTVTKTRISAAQERFDVFINGGATPVAQIPGPLAQAAQARSRQCIRWPVGGTQADCYVFATAYRDSLTTTATVAYSPVGDTVILAIARDSFAYDIGGFETNASDNFLLNGPVSKSLSSLLYFIPVRGGTERGPVSHAARVERIGVSEDGAYTVIQGRILFFQSTNQISGPPVVAKTNACQAAFQHKSGSLSIFVPTYSYNLPADRRPCWAGSTFAP